MRDLRHSAAEKASPRPWVGELKPLAGAQESWIETLIERPEYKLELEHTPIDGDRFAYTLHFEVFVFTPRVLRLMDADWTAIRPKIKAPIFAANQDEDEKWRKFVRRFGFRYFRDCVGTDGSLRGLYIHI